MIGIHLLQTVCSASQTWCVYPLSPPPSDSTNVLICRGHNAERSEEVTFKTETLLSQFLSSFHIYETDNSSPGENGFDSGQSYFKNIKEQGNTKAFLSSKRPVFLRHDFMIAAVIVGQMRSADHWNSAMWNNAKAEKDEEGTL